MNATPPSEFSTIGLVGHFMKAGPTEWHGPCPFCGGTDRFVVFTDRKYPSWNWFCRQCHPEHGWVDEINPQLKEQERRMTPAEKTQRAIEQAQEAERRLQREIERANQALKELQEARTWMRYHEQLTDEARAKWESWGIPEFYQEYWQLGYDPDRVILSGGTEWHTPTMTIPIFEPGWNCINIRHRLLNPPKPSDKYRPERSGLPASLYIAEPELGLTGRTILVEGEKKAMVTFITADDPNMQVVGIPGKTPNYALIEKMGECNPVYIILDPDAQADARRVALMLGHERCRLIELPGKIDDLIIAHDLDKFWMRRVMRQAVKA